MPARFAPFIALVVTLSACSKSNSIADGFSDAAMMNGDAAVESDAQATQLDMNTADMPGATQDAAMTPADANMSSDADVLADASAAPDASSSIFSIHQDVYIKTTNTNADDEFGSSMALSADGNTLAIGAPGEDSDARGVGGDQTNNAASRSGAIYVFVRTAGVWTQQAYIKTSNSDANDEIGISYRPSLRLSADGNTLVASAKNEASNATGIGGNEADNSMATSGAVYVFTRVGTTWSQQAYIKASNTETADMFGTSIALSSDGNTLAVGAHQEDSSALRIDGVQTNNGERNSGAVYVFTRSGSAWAQQAYVKATNTQADDYFGMSVALSGDGNLLAVGAPYEDSNAIGIDGSQANDDATNSGAVYVLARSGSTWTHQSYVKASNTDLGDNFGWEVALSADGSTLAIGAPNEASNANGVGGDQTNNDNSSGGAVYVFVRAGSSWTQQSYIKSAYSVWTRGFGENLSLSADGSGLAVGVRIDWSDEVGIDGDPTRIGDTGLGAYGAAYVFARSGSTWAQRAYVKASNTGGGDVFGSSIALCADGHTLAVGAPKEDSEDIGIDGNQANNSAMNAGAAYVFSIGF